MKRSLLIASTFLSAMTFAQDCADLFISEYVEGKGNNKALEIYNPTANAIQLNEYFLQRYSNGANVASAEGTFEAQSIQLPSYSLPPYTTYLVVLDRHAGNSSAQDPAVDSELYDMADAVLCSSYAVNNAMNFNGNDAMVLAKGSAVTPNSADLIDVFGKIGEDPGLSWTSVAPYTQAAGGAFLTRDKSLIRKSGILHGVTNPAITSFNALAEYDSIPAEVSVGVGNWSSLGWHACNCAPASINEISASSISIFPNPSNGSFTIKGIEGITSIQVVNSLGQTVESIDSNTSSIVKIDLSNRKGVYFVKLMDKSGDLITKKVIIK